MIDTYRDDGRVLTAAERQRRETMQPSFYELDTRTQAEVRASIEAHFDELERRDYAGELDNATR